MSQIIDLYLDRVLTHAELEEPRATEVREELSDHLHSHREKVLASGKKPEDASIQAIAKMGDPKKVGQSISRPWRWVDIRTHGTAKGFIAIGPKAIGVFAFGNACCGIIAIGVLPVGIISIGALGLGLFTWAAIAAGGVALGGLAIGAVASGGVAIGILAEGLATIGASSAPAWMHSHHRRPPLDDGAHGNHRPLSSFRHRHHSRNPLQAPPRPRTKSRTLDLRLIQP